MCTDEGDLVVDPFAGSCVTGAVAERLGRRWICCDTEERYLEGAVCRFDETGLAARPYDGMAYPLYRPGYTCTNLQSNDSML